MTAATLTLRRYAPMWPVLSWALFAVGALYCVAALLGMVGYPGDPVPGDAWNYWQGLAYSSEHYRYSPVFYWATAPLRALPFEAFMVVWTAAHLAAVVWLGPWTILLAFDDVIRGNINTFLAVGVVLAVRGHGWTWALPLLTKVTPGVGVLYHVGRREWWPVMWAMGATAALILVFWPLGLWTEWVGSLAAGTTNYETIDVLAPLPVRIVVGAVLCLAAARWVWLLPVGMIVAMPGLWPASFALLTALPRLTRSGASRRSC